MGSTWSSLPLQQYQATPNTFDPPKIQGEFWSKSVRRGLHFQRNRKTSPAPPFPSPRLSPHKWNMDLWYMKYRAIERMSRKTHKDKKMCKKKWDPLFPLRYVKNLSSTTPAFATSTTRAQKVFLETVMTSNGEPMQDSLHRLYHPYKHIQQRYGSLCVCLYVYIHILIDVGVFLTINVINWKEFSVTHQW